MRWILLTMTACVLAGGPDADCQGQDASSTHDDPASQTQPFRLRGADTGIDFQHFNGATGEHYVIEPYSAGLAIFDYDGDGLEDVYFLNGCPLPPAADATVGPVRNQLFRNLGNWQFANVTESAGLGDAGYGLGCAAGDFDNDGDADLYVANFGDNAFFVNNGDGTFTDSTIALDLGGQSRFSAGIVWLDIERDGDLDLFCGNYQRFEFDQHIVRMIGDQQFHPGPLDYPAEHDQLFRNEGDGTFTDISEESGVSSHAATSMGAIAVDFDLDGDDDLFVANDNVPNHLLVNDGSGHFTEEALLAGVAYDRQGDSNGNMGVDCGDLDRDGWLDLVTTTYQDEMPVYYRNAGGGFFDDATPRLKLDRTLYAHVNWGVGVADFNNDGATDVFIACGHFMDNIAAISDTTQVKVRDYLQLNSGGGTLKGADHRLLSEAPVESARGAAFADLDQDGDLDAVVLNVESSPTILENQLVDGTSARNAWVGVRLVGRISNRDAGGAIVTLQSDGWKQTAAVHLGRGYQSHYGQTLHFGLPADWSQRTWSASIKWPSGHTSEVSLREFNKVHMIHE